MANLFIFVVYLIGIYIFAFALNWLFGKISGALTHRFCSDNTPVFWERRCCLWRALYYRQDSPYQIQT